MKKILISVLVMGAFMVGSINAAITDHPNWGQISAFQSSIVGTINGLQQAFYVTHGYYFQGIMTPVEGTSLDGTEEVQIAYGLKPSDQDVSWFDFSPNDFKLGTKFRMHVRINRITAPEGDGYHIILDFRFPGIGPDNYGNDGEHWIYKHAHGPVAVSPEIWDEWYIEPDEGLEISNKDRKDTK
jgi:hypothetical protein